MGFIREKLNGWSGFIVALLSTSIMAFSSLEHLFGVEIMSILAKIPYIGIIYEYPITSLLIMLGVFILVFRGNALPRFFAKLTRGPRG